MYRIMIVEDDPTIVEVLERHLEKWGYTVCAAVRFDAVLEQFAQFRPHLVLLDISLPFYNGFYWCGEIRKVSAVPIVFLSSAGDDMNLVMAINMGADDFIAKPFHLDVVTAKLHAVLRRAYAIAGDPNVIEHRGAVLDLGDASITCGGRRAELTRNEFKILQVLLANRGTAVARETIMRALWESESFIDDNTLTVNMTRLRKKLDGIGLADFVVTKKGLGYLVEA